MHPDDPGEADGAIAAGPAGAITPLDGSLFGPGQPCFGCAPDHPHGFRLRFERQGDVVVTRFVPGAEHQGPPGVMHGGLVSTLADELGAWTVVALLGKFAFTVAFSGRFRRPLRIGAEIEGRGRIAKGSSRIVDVAVELRQAGEQAFAGELRFALLDAGGAERLLGGPIPEAWQRFCR